MNTRKGEVKFKKTRILLDSGCSSTIVMGRIVEKLHPKQYAVMQWHTQAGNITTDIKFEVEFTLPELRVTNVETWKCYVYDYANGRYCMSLGIDL